MASKLAGDERISKMTANIPHPYHEQMAKDWIATHGTNWQQQLAIVYAIELKQTNELIGTISLTQMRENKANLGYWIGVPFWGNGYCSEAAKALLTFAFKQISLQMVYAIHLKENPASGKVMLNSY